MSYMDNAKLLAVNLHFKTRMRFSLLKVASQISAEDPAELGADQAAKRHSLATAAMIGGSVNGTYMVPDGIRDSFVHVLAANEVMLNSEAETVEDSVYDAAVTAHWDEIAGVSYADKQTA